MNHNSQYSTTIIMQVLEYNYYKYYEILNTYAFNIMRYDVFISFPPQRLCNPIPFCRRSGSFQLPFNCDGFVSFFSHLSVGVAVRLFLFRVTSYLIRWSVVLRTEIKTKTQIQWYAILFGQVKYVKLMGIE